MSSTLFNTDPWFGGSHAGGVAGLGGFRPPPKFDRPDHTVPGFNGGGTPNNFDFGGSGNKNPLGGSPSLTGNTLPFYAGLDPGKLSKIFGNLGPLLSQGILTGGYNPAVVDALIKQLQPEIDRGVATIGANTGASGTRFGSGYDLALGDYLSQVNNNEGALAAGLYEDAVHNSFGLLENAINPLAQSKSNEGGFGSSLLTSLLGAFGPKLLSKIPGLGDSGGVNPTQGNIPGVIYNFNDVFGNNSNASGLY